MKDHIINFCVNVRMTSLWRDSTENLDDELSSFTHITDLTGLFMPFRFKWGTWIMKLQGLPSELIARVH